MSIALRFKVLVLGLIFSSPFTAGAQRGGDPLSGIWKGDWGPSSMDRNTVTLELRWDGKTLTGAVNPGPDGIAIENASFDPAVRKIHLEATYAARNLRYIVDGSLEGNKISGTWNHPRRKGDFQVTREARSEESSQPADAPKLTGLGRDERRVVQYLLKDWGQDFSITSVDIATKALGLKASGAFRFRVGDYIKNHPELHQVIRQWGWQTVVLTPDQKLVARAIVNAERHKEKAPSITEVAKGTGLSKKEAENAVAILARFGILKRDDSAGGVGYVAAEPRYLNWQPWLDFQFHQATLASSGRSFAVN